MRDPSDVLEAGFDRLTGQFDEMSSKADDLIAFENDKYRGVKHFRLPLMQGLVASAAISIGESSLTNPILVGPLEGYMWSLRRLVVAGLSAGSAATAAVSSTATGAITAGAGSAALANGVPASGFTLSFSTAPSTTGTAVLSNVTGGPYTYNIPSGQTSPYTVVFPAPITTTSAGVAATLTVAGLTAGAGNIELYGLTPGAAAVAADVVQLFRSSSAQQGGLLWEFTGTTAGKQVIISEGGMYLGPGDKLLLVNSGALTAANGTQITLSGEVDETPAEMYAKLVVG